MLTLILGLMKIASIRIKEYISFNKLTGASIVGHLDKCMMVMMTYDNVWGYFIFTLLYKILQISC